MKKTGKAETYKPAPHVSWRAIDEEAVILNVDTGEYYSLEPTAAAIWKGIEKGRSLPEIARKLSGLCGVPEARVLKDTREFVADLLKEKLITPG